MPPEPIPGDDHRNRRDRRRRDLPIWHPRRLHGRRMKMRRRDEHDLPYLVDRVPWTFLPAALLLLTLTLLDGLITVALLDQGFEEANPAMRYLLDRGTTTFLVGKYVLTAVFLPVALVMNRHTLFGTRLRVGHFLPVVAALYVLLIVYQGVLWTHRPLPVSRPKLATGGASAGTEYAR